MPYQLNTSKLFLTYPQCSIPLEEVLNQLYGKLESESIEDYIVANELHANGDRHRHVYLRLREAFRTRDPKCFDLRNQDGTEAHGNYQGCRSFKNVVRYCSKNEDYISNMDVAAKLDGSTTHKRRDIAKRLMGGESLAKITEEIPELLFGYRNLRRDLEMYRTDKRDAIRREGTCGVWIYGPPGAGKSHRARADYGDTRSVFTKSQNKWWDGYDGERKVILDDLDSNALGHLLKIWADKWPCYGEVKGGTVPLMHETFIVTSNYSIEALFDKDEKLCEALKRRFDEEFMTKSDRVYEKEIENQISFDKCPE